MEEARIPESRLLKIKHNTPGSGNRLMPRQQLNLKLANALNCRLTVVTAPAGYGKTTAVIKWLESRPQPHAWLSIDEGDNNPSVFWRYFYAALNGFFGNIEKDVEYVFSSHELFQSNIHINILINRLSEIQTDFIYVLDDLHLIKNQEVLNALTNLIYHIPSNFHIILLSRTAPDLKLHRLDLKEDMVCIKAEDLLFDTEEIDTYLKTRGHFLSQNEILKIESYTEGWAAALVAVSLSFRDEKSIQSVIGSFKNCNRRIEDYLIEDVMGAWTAQQRDFMERISILDKFCGSLCGAVTGYDGDKMLHALYQQNSFFAALDDECIWFRFHHLFRDFLRKNLETRPPGLMQDLHRKAGEWLALNGLCEEAMEQFLQGAQYEQAAVLLDQLWDLIRVHGNYSNIFPLVSRLPDKYTMNSPSAMFFKIYHAIEIEDFTGALKALRKLEQFIEKNPCASEAVHKEYMMAKANLYFEKCDLKSLMSAIEDAASFGLKANYDYTDFNTFDISAYRAKTYNMVAMIRENPSGFYSMLRGYRAQIKMNPGYAPLAAGEYYYESGRFNESLSELAAAIDEALDAACPGALVPAMVTLAKIKRASGDINSAFSIIEECENKVAEWNKPHWVYLLKAFKMRLHLDSGNTEAADRWIADSGLGVFQEITALREYELIVLARTFIAKRRCEDASLLLSRLLGFAKAKNRTHSTVEICNLLAITALLSQDEEAAFEYIEKSLRIGKEEALVRSFVDELLPMTSLLELYLRMQNGGTLEAYAKELLDQTNMNLRRSMPSLGINTVEKLLTPAENKVLRLLMGACTYNEIAAELRITLSTVKAHVSSIYKKLGVKSRAQCMNRVGDISA